MRRNAMVAEKSTPEAIGNDEIHSGEFCRGMTLFRVILHVLFMEKVILT